jgi:23S rRNA (guanosine2251-2'-O)-methyltransferase
MIVRSAAAAGIDGILWPQRGVAALGPLVIKASAGALFRAPIIHCQQVSEALERCQSLGMAIATLDGASTTSVFDYRADRPTVFVLGSESEGVSANATASADISLAIPMANGVESLNVAVAAGILAYATARQPG